LRKMYQYKICLGGFQADCTLNVLVWCNSIYV
jgi:hypothetical protein